MLIRAVVCGYAIAARLVEIRVSRANIASNKEEREGAWSRRSFPLMVLLHSVVLGGTLVRGSHPRSVFLAIFLVLQPLRRWVLRSLGRRWNARGMVPTEMKVVTDGPYAHIRHPNYAIVALELFSLPAAFGLLRLALAATVSNAVLLWLRIRDEEALLMQLPDYREHFAHKPRFIPSVSLTGAKHRQRS